MTGRHTQRILACKRACLIFGIIIIAIGVCGINVDCWQSRLVDIGTGAGLIIATLIIWQHYHPVDGPYGSKTIKTLQSWIKEKMD